MGAEVFYIGLDDTDIQDSIGTGALAREMMLFLRRELDARPRGITRHQLFVHPDIPYTSHNSAACLEISCGIGLDEISGACRRFVALLPHPGADPGLCVCDDRPPPKDFSALGRRTQEEIVAKQEALDCARRHRIGLWELGGTGLGVIGALSACALRMGKDDGRFISLNGIRDLPRHTTVGEIMNTAPIAVVMDQAGRELEGSCPIDTNNWVRPDLKAGRIILQVRKRNDAPGYFIAGKKGRENH